MADAVLFAESRGSALPRVRANWNLQLPLDLLSSALLLGLWRVWSSAMAPRLGVYFTAEALLIVYAYFAVIRGVNVDVRGHDQTGRYSRLAGQKASREFARELGRYWLKVALVLLPLLLAALALDVLTADSGLQHRPNVHFSILFVEIMVWARYGGAVIVAAARWSPLRPPAFGHARELAGSAPVARSFALTNLSFAAAALAGVACYKWGGTLLTSARADVLCSAALFTTLAWLALWLHCRWARSILPLIVERSAFDAPTHGMPRAA